MSSEWSIQCLDVVKLPDTLGIDHLGLELRVAVAREDDPERSLVTHRHGRPTKTGGDNGIDGIHVRGRHLDRVIIQRG